jgi:hypothetical protein
LFYIAQGHLISIAILLVILLGLSEKLQLQKKGIVSPEFRRSPIGLSSCL